MQPYRSFTWDNQKGTKQNLVVDEMLSKVFIGTVEDGGAACSLLASCVI